MQQLHAQLETTNEHKNILDPIGVKKRLEDYEQMLQYYIMTKTEKKTKEYDIESKKWWEVGKEYFGKDWRRIWFNIELMRKTSSANWRYILKHFQSLFVEVQQV